MKKVRGAAALGVLIGAGGAACSLYSRSRWGRSLRASACDGLLRAASHAMRKDRLIPRMAVVLAPSFGARLPRSLRKPGIARLFGDMPVAVLGDPRPASTVIVFLHGGGYTYPMSAAHGKLLVSLSAGTDARIYAPAYPLAPGFTWEQAHSEVFRLYAKVLDENPGARIILMGDSAGGGFALALALEAAEAGVTIPDELILISPWVDLTCTNPRIPEYEALDPWLGRPTLEVFARGWAGTTAYDDWHLSPINADLSPLSAPGTRVTSFVGAYEVLFPDVQALHDGLRAAGVEECLHIGRALPHVYPLFPTPEAKSAVREMIRIIRSR